MEVLIVADDLTGALDTASQFGDSLVVLDPSTKLDSRVVAVSSDSRKLPPGAAAEKVYALLQALPGSKYLYKKVDSTMRGNVGPELEVVVRFTGSSIPFTPAFPEQGRTVRNGKLFVNDIPLEETQYVDELPLRSSNLLELLKANSSLNPCYWGEGGGDVLVFRDVRDREDIASAFEMVIEKGLEKVMSGSAGLAMELAKHLGVSEAEKPSSSGPILVASGSKNEVTLRQLRRLSHHIPTHRVSDEKSIPLSILREGGDLAITSYLGGAPKKEDWLGLTSFVWEAAELIGALILIGGETTKLILKCLGAKAIRVGRPPEMGIAAGWILGGKLHGKPILTKAGGFGDEETIIRMWRWLK